MYETTRIHTEQGKSIQFTLIDTFICVHTATQCEEKEREKKGEVLSFSYAGFYTSFDKKVKDETQ